MPLTVRFSSLSMFCLGQIPQLVGSDSSCVTREDLVRMKRNKQLAKNPYTHERFTYTQKVDIEDVLAGIPVIYD